MAAKTSSSRTFALQNSKYSRAERAGRLQEFSRFAANGILSFAVDYGTLIFLKEALGVHYLLSAGISFSLSVGVNYVICRAWVFQSRKRRDFWTIPLFLATSVGGLALNQLIMWVMVDIASCYYLVAKIVATCIVLIWNYVTKRKVMTS